MAQPQRPTRGQQRILQLVCRANYVLVGGISEAPWEHTAYTLRERGTGRSMQRVTSAMANSLRHAGWIEPDGSCGSCGDAREWTYRVTQAGIAAANGAALTE